MSWVVGNHPRVYIKSLATTMGEARELDIDLTATGSDRSGISHLLDAAVKDLLEGLVALGIGHSEKVRN